MFKKKEKRFITRGIDSNVPRELQIFCWQVIDEFIKGNNYQVDYLQIFEFEEKQSEELKVIHRQEEPKYQKSYEFRSEGNLSKCKLSKLWVIDDGENQTMLLPEEY